MGCGRVGATLTRSLERRGHTTAVIDSNPDAFRRLGPSFKGITVTGMGFDKGVLEEAGIEKADGFAAVSSGDNSNIISARVAREQFGVTNIIARIYDPGRAEVYERLGVRNQIGADRGRRLVNEENLVPVLDELDRDTASDRSGSGDGDPHHSSSGPASSAAWASSASSSRMKMFRTSPSWMTVSLCATCPAPRRVR